MNTLIVLEIYQHYHLEVLILRTYHIQGIVFLMSSIEMGL
nr:MAG TPA: hypothetical protein [Caudoviricetes sp.]